MELGQQPGLPDDGGSQDLSNRQPYTYPEPLFIRNTFLGTGPDRPPSLEGFYHERDVRSCPVSLDNENDSLAAALLLAASSAATANTPAAPRSAHDTARVPPSPPRPSEEITVQELDVGPAGASDTVSEAVALAFAAGIRRGRPAAASTASANEDRPSDVQVLHLADAIDSPSLGSSELPTLGSAGHGLGNCKPCAFLDKGCTSGTDCKFCHLCPADEKKRRKKEKLAMRRQMSKWQESFPSPWSFNGFYF